MVSMGTKRQFKMYLPDDFLGHLEKIAEKAGKPSAQVVVEEILEIYLPVWAAVNESMRRAVNYQIGKIGEEMAKTHSTPVDFLGSSKPSERATRKRKKN